MFVAVKAAAVVAMRLTAANRMVVAVLWLTMVMVLTVAVTRRKKEPMTLTAGIGI